MDQEKLSRLESATRLNADLLPTNEDLEYFSDAESRLELLQTMTKDDFEGLLIHINARMRDIEPREHSFDGAKSRIALGKVADSRDKEKVLETCFSLISEFLNTRDDLDLDERLLRSSMAVESAIIYVHPFADGNGRTSRYLASFIENGSSDIEQLQLQTASSKYWGGALRAQSARPVSSGCTVDLPVAGDPFNLRFPQETTKQFPVKEENRQKLFRLINDSALDKVITASLERHCDLEDKKNEHGEVSLEYVAPYMDDSFIDTLDNMIRNYKNSVPIQTTLACLSDEERSQKLRKEARFDQL